jgi:hypothetical protein
LLGRHAQSESHVLLAAVFHLASDYLALSTLFSARPSIRPVFSSALVEYNAGLQRRVGP